MTPIHKIADRIYGGPLNDLFVIDQLEYEADTTVFVDNGHVAIFKAKNPIFKGKVILFDAAQDNIRELVDQEIKAPGYWSTTFSQFKEGTFQEVTLNGTLITAEAIEELFSNLGWSYSPNHNHHFFSLFEQFVLPVNTPFIKAALTDTEDCHDLPFLAPLAVDVYQHAAEFVQQQLMAEASSKSEYLQRTLKSWQRSVSSWFTVHKRLSRLLSEHELKLNRSHLQHWLENRDNFETLTQLETEIIDTTLKRSDSRLLPTTIGYEWQGYLPHQHETLTRICEYVQLHIPTWSQGPAIMSWFAISYLFNPNYSIDAAMQAVLARYIGDSAEQATAQPEAAFQQAANHFWLAIKKDKSEKAHHSLTLIERFGLLLALASILKELKLATLDVLDFDTLLKIAPMTRSFYGEDNNSLLNYGSFMKSYLRGKSVPTTLEEAIFWHP
ncbi:hypothetical protein [Candidatus Odyssella thessalonicensis]|uniref:hypothetical protein n=1 Tax=Candidatus Odyssella thessalonicensis TaxID=84647 RepID=UPI000225B4BC|nr:hypothetical protein [Candidatus Odyssella thessalonicensis]